MKRLVFAAMIIAVLITVACAANGTPEKLSTTGTVTEGTETYRGFALDNVLHSPRDGDIHYNVYIPASYDGSRSYAAFFTVPMPIYSLLDEYDFSGKTIIPVITHAGSRDGGTLSVLRAEEPNATVPDNAFVSAASSVAGQKAAVESWLDGLREYWK